MVASNYSELDRRSHASGLRWHFELLAVVFNCQCVAANKISSSALCELMVVIYFISLYTALCYICSISINMLCLACGFGEKGSIACVQIVWPAFYYLLFTIHRNCTCKCKNLSAVKKVLYQACKFCHKDEIV